MSPPFHHRKRSKSLERSSSNSSLNTVDRSHDRVAHSQPMKPPSLFPLILDSPRSVKSDTCSGRRWRVPKRIKLPGQKMDSDQRASKESLNSSRGTLPDMDSDAESIIPSSQTSLCRFPRMKPDERTKDNTSPETQSRTFGKSESSSLSALSETGPTTPTGVRSKNVTSKGMVRMRPFTLNLAAENENGVSSNDASPDNSAILGDSEPQSAEKVLTSTTKRGSLVDNQNKRHEEKSSLNFSKVDGQASNVFESPSFEAEGCESSDDLSIFENDVTQTEFRNDRERIWPLASVKSTSVMSAGQSNRKGDSPKKRSNLRELETDSSIAKKRKLGSVDSVVGKSPRNSKNTPQKSREILNESLMLPDSADDLDIFSDDLVTFFPENAENVSAVEQDPISVPSNDTLDDQDEREVEKITDNGSQAIDKVCLSGKYHEGKSKWIVEKYGLKGPGSQTKEGLTRMLLDLKEELSLSFEKLTKLTKLKIKVPNLPRQHEIDGLWTYERGNTKMKHFTADEISIIMNNWREFRKAYGFKKRDVCLFLPYSPWMMNKRFTESKIRFAQFLAQNLPDRPVKSVYWKFVDLCQSDRCGYTRRFTDSDDLIMRLVLKHFPGHYLSILKYLLHLSSRVIMKRLREKGMYCDGRQKDLFVEPASSQVSEASSSFSSMSGRKYDGLRLWSIVTLALERVLGELQPRLGVDESTSLHYPAWTKINEVWSRLSEETSLPVLALKKIIFTRLLPMAVDFGRIGMKRKRVKHFDFKISMIEKLYQERRCSWEEIDWVEVSESLGGIGSVFVYSLFRKSVKKYVPCDLWSSFRRTIEHLHEKVLPAYRKASSDDVLFLRMIPNFHHFVTPKSDGKCRKKNKSDSESESD